VPQNGYCKLYRLPAVAGHHTAMLMDSIYLGNNDNSARVTSADINHQTGELVLLTAKRIISFTDYVGDRFFNGVKREYFFSSDQGQIEAIQFYADRKLYMTEEGNSTNPGKLYRVDLGDFTGLETTQESTKIKLFPNPSAGLFQLTLAADGLFEAQLFLGQGALVRQLMVKNGTELDLSSLKPGTYYLNVLVDHKKISIPLIKL